MAKTKDNEGENVKTSNPHTIEYDKNQCLIIAAYNDYLEEHNTFPTHAKLAEMTKLSRQTIVKHHKDFNVSELKEKFRTFAPQVFNDILKSSKDGKSASQNLALQAMEVMKMEETGNIIININLPEFLRKDKKDD